MGIIIDKPSTKEGTGNGCDIEWRARTAQSERIWLTAEQEALIQYMVKSAFNDPNISVPNQSFLDYHFDTGLTCSKDLAISHCKDEIKERKFDPDNYDIEVWPVYVYS